jgi:hypothetical protein
MYATSGAPKGLKGGAKITLTGKKEQPLPTRSPPFLQIVTASLMPSFRFWFPNEVAIMPPMMIRVRRFSFIAARPWLFVGIAAASAVGGVAQAKPKEIIIEASPSQNKDKAAFPLTDLEKQALENALVAGAVENDPPIRITKTSRKMEQELIVRNGRCYSVSIAWKGTYRATVSYSMMRGSDGRPLNDFATSESGQSFPGEGILQFCVDRAGTVKLEVLADESSGPADAVREYAIVAGYRTETPAQVEARRHRAQAQKQKAEAAKAATPAPATKQ